MRSRILAAVAFAGLLMTAIPLTASAHDKATCSHEPAWGYTHPNWYRGWWQNNCGSRYGYSPEYFGNGGGWWSNPPAYGYGAPRYTYNDGYRNDWYRNDRRWDRDHDGWRSPRFAHPHEVHPNHR